MNLRAIIKEKKEPKQPVTVFFKFDSNKCSGCDSDKRDRASDKYNLNKVNCNAYDQYVGEEIEILENTRHNGIDVSICKVVGTSNMLILKNHEIKTI